MFSYLRPSSRRYGAPAPASPAASSESSYFPPNLLLRHKNDDGSMQSSSPISPVPPVLPPIPRVASRHGTDKPNNDFREAKEQIWATTPQEETAQHPSPMIEQLAALYTEETRPSQGLETAYPPILYDTTKARRSQRLPNNATLIMPSQQPPASSAHPHQTRQAFHKPKQLSATTIAQGIQNKTRLNLLNPMALLARRRSSLAVSQPFSDRYSHQKNSIVPGMSLPDDYDPRIRGNVVHDFSAPRPRRYLSSIDTRPSHANHGVSSDKHVSPINSQNYDSHPIDQHDLDSCGSRKGWEDDITGWEPSPPEHTPVFKEHFEDDVEPMPDDFGVSGTKRASGFLYQVSVTQSAHSSLPLPPFAKPVSRSITPTKPPSPSQPKLSSREAHSAVNSAAAQASKLPLDPVPETQTPSISPVPLPSIRSPPVSPPQRRSRAFSSTESTPKHTKSNASRFSFDLGAVGSAAQEKLLEEKHRQKAAQRARLSMSSALETEGGTLNEEDDNNYYDEDTDGNDGFEERIPGVNADSEEDSFTEPSRHQCKALSSIESSHSSPVSPMSTDYIPSDMPHNSEGHPIGFAVFEVSPDISHSVDSLTGKDDSASGYTYSHGTRFPASRNQMNDQQQLTSDGDELYFDDGIIEDLNEEDGPVFDESVFDDDSNRVYGLPLRDLKPLPLMKNQPSREEGQLLISGDEEHVLEDPINDASLTSDVMIGAIGPKPSLVNRCRSDKPVLNRSAELTRDNLAAFHNALAFAANKASLAEVSTKRQQNPNVTSPGLALLDDLVRPSSTNSRTVNTSEYGVHFDDNLVDEGGCVNLDDMDEDDAIIAAANAEALENDEEGFYGQEFGFFAQATDSADAQYANGGYFGPRGVEGVKRSCSGRANFQEPSLTPITERSEWSNRDSMISLALQHGYTQSAHTLPSPSVTHLADFMRLEDDGNMSLSALMRLRHGAWGGSNASLQSSSTQSQISGSPINYLPPMMTTGIPITGNGVNGINLMGSNHSLTGSNHSLPSSNAVFSDDENPTITIQTQGLVMAPYMQSQYSHSSASSESSPVKRGPPWQKGHRRDSSSAESVSYVRVGDEEGGRWVLEKRRLLEGGGMEVLDREVVEGGRI